MLEWIQIKFSRRTSSYSTQLKMNEVDYIQPYETDSFTSSILSEKIENLSKNIPKKFNTNFFQRYRQNKT